MMRPMDLNLATSRFTGFQREYGVPVRITVGAPRFFQQSHEFVKVLAPFGIFKNANLPTVQMRHEAYIDRLDKHADQLMNELYGLTEAYPGATLCLLCYENVHKGEVCHRRWAADWFLDRYSIVVPEIGPTRSPMRKSVEVTEPGLTLF